MGVRRLITTDIAKKEAVELHGTKYDYSLMEYIDCKTPLKIICPEHGLFEQKYDKHCKLGRGCWECGKKSCADKNRMSQAQYIEKANIVHNNFYGYSKTEYYVSTDIIVVECPIHGYFSVNAASHMTGTKCKKCAHISNGIQSRKGKEHILKKFKEKHGDFYTYNVKDDVKTDDSIEIGCPVHGIFSQVVKKHYLHGCSKCGDDSVSLKTRKIPKELEKLSRNVRRSVKSFIKRHGYSKTSRTYQIIGASWEELKNHLEDNLYGFTIDCPDINIDHIIPLASMKEEKDIYTLNHYSNLQLLPKDYNQFIKKENPFDILDFEKWLIETNYNKC